MENDQTWIERLISIIGEKPVLYNKSTDEYSDKEKKRIAWNEVCEVVVENWGDLSPEERQEKDDAVQRRWKSLRTCFARELKAQKKGFPGQMHYKKRRKYMYYDQLMFLLPSMDDKEALRELTAREATTGSTETELDQQGHNEEEAQSQARRLVPSTSLSKKRHGSYDETLLNILHDKRGEIDEDKAFLLSLLPAMKRMREEHKCEAKIEMLRLVNKFR